MVSCESGTGKVDKRQEAEGESFNQQQGHAVVAMDEFEVLEKKQELKELKKKQDAVKLENAMLSEHLSRVMMRKGSMQLHLENLEAEQMEQDEEERAAAAAAAASLRRKSTQRSFRIFQEAPAAKQSVRFSLKSLGTRARSAEGTPRVPMSLEEKMEIVDEEIGAHSEQMNRTRTENERILEDLRAVIQATEFAMREVTNDKNSLNRDLLVLAELSPRKKLHTEDFLRFQDERLRKKRNLREKLQEKIDLLHMEIMEAEHQFAGKRDLSEILHPVDFDWYKIMNRKLSNRIHERTKDLWKLKGILKGTGQLLYEARTKLEKKTTEGTMIRHHIVDRSQQIAASQDLIALEKKQHRKLTEDMLRLIQETDGPAQSHVIDYMKMRIKSADLRRELTRWLTKVEVMEQNTAQLRRHVRTALRQRDAALVNTTPENTPRVALVQG